MNGIQQLRKSAGLDLKDVVEVFFCEADGVSLVEDAVARNVALFEAKFKGSVPLPQRFAPKWSVALQTGDVTVGGTTVSVSICRPSLASSDSLAEPALSVLSILETSSVSKGQVLKYSVDSKEASLTEGVDFWLSSLDKLRVTKEVAWV